MFMPLVVTMIVFIVNTTITIPTAILEKGRNVSDKNGFASKKFDEFFNSTRDYFALFHTMTINYDWIPFQKSSFLVCS